MNIAVEYKDTSGNIFHQTHQMNWLAFAKHLAVAGQGYAPQPSKLFRGLGMFLHYSNFMQGNAFRSDKFSEPPIGLSDPTEKGQFSNLAGRAIADFLSKRIDQSIYTVNYEAAMRLKNIPLSINGKQVRRPDLLAFKTTGAFAIEAKGYSGGCGDMTAHKAQSQTGGISVNYTIASVAYNLYDQVKCKYHDPFNENIPFDSSLLAGLTKNYYQGLLKFLNEKLFRVNELVFQDEGFYEVELSRRSFEKLFSNKLLSYPFWHHDFFDFYSPVLILPRDIRDYAQIGLSRQTVPFLSSSIEQQDDIYIDNDRVGLRFRRL